MPVFCAGMRPFGYGFCDGPLAEGEVDPLIVQATGGTRPAVNTEGRGAAVIVLLGPGKAEREPPASGRRPLRPRYLAAYDGRGDLSPSDDWPTTRECMDGA